MSSQGRYDQLHGKSMETLAEIASGLGITDAVQDKRSLCTAIMRAEAGAEVWGPPGFTDDRPMRDKEKFQTVIKAMFPNSTLRTDPNISNVARWILEEGLPEFVQRFMDKNADYGDQHATIGLGPKAEFVGLWRKIYKLRESLWREKPMLNEDTEEMLDDIIGTCLLIRHLMAIENGDEPQPTES